ncbi:MAG: sigma 54-interacting transcriptional regulator, partial [Tissierellia bacterium]|nr:sigma 54-interacting transcriptional regulator [Tissierellia bacterium]
MYAEKEVYSKEQFKIPFNLKNLEENQKQHIIYAWERCKKYGLKPYDNIITFRYTGQELEKVLEDSKNLIESSKPFMENLYSLVKDTGFVIILTNEKGCLLEIIGDSEPLKQLSKKLDTNKGAVWDEKYVGNTAITTSIIEGEPTQLSGNEHYLSCLNGFFCSSAPIRQDGKIIGALNVMGYKDNSHAHTLAMVAAVTKSIESYMELNKTNDQLIIKNKYQNAIVECISDGFLTIDNNGRLTYINGIGADILGIDREKSIGKHVKDLVDFDPVILSVLETGEGYQDKEFIVRNKYGAKYHFIKSAVPIKDADGNIIGVVDNFRKINRVHNMVRNMVGAYGKFTFEDIIGNSDSMQETIRLSKIASRSSSNVLVYGESGTGKEMIVQSIHNASRRKNQSFVSINCAAIPSELIESELFGYEAGAFTGALKTGQTGKFELANGGTIFLDEIGDMPLHLQGKLLRVLQENQITRVGGTDVIDIDVRIISATNKNLLKECKKGNFREDLYYRLNVLNINIPPLRKRKEDIESLVYHFISKINQNMDKKIKGITDEALEALIKYDWPGNVRELENIVERAMNICMEDKIGIEHISVDIIEGDMENLPTETNIEYYKSKDKIRSFEEIEKEAILHALNITDGNISKAAEGLNISRNTLYNKIAKYK